MQHIPVMLRESLAIFEKQSIRVFFDGTLGAGGFARALLTAHPEIEIYIGCDRDEEALSIAKDVLADWREKVHFLNGNFRYCDRYLQEKGIEQVDGFFLT